MTFPNLGKRTDRLVCCAANVYWNGFDCEDDCDVCVLMASVRLYRAFLHTLSLHLVVVTPCCLQLSNCILQFSAQTKNQKIIHVCKKNTFISVSDCQSVCCFNKYIVEIFLAVNNLLLLLLALSTIKYRCFVKILMEFNEI